MNRKVIYKSKAFTIEEEVFKIRGKDKIISRIIESNVVAILPLLDERTVLLEKQYRFAIKKYIYELPAGFVGSGEKPRDAAKRELHEETGYIAGKLAFMFKSYTSPGRSTRIVYNYCATELNRAKRDLGEAEVIKLEEFDIDELERMIKKNEIMDTKTIACSLYYKNYFS